MPNFGEFADPAVFAQVARRAEEAGWDWLTGGRMLRRIEQGPPRL